MANKDWDSEASMKILFVHQNFPGQFLHIAPRLAAIGHDVKAFVLRDIKPTRWKGLEIVPYSLTRGNTQGIDTNLIDLESKLIRGYGCQTAAHKLKSIGYEPDLIVAHPGWGESLFLRHVWPQAKIKLYFEYFYNEKGYDVGFDPEYQDETEDMYVRNQKLMLKNANLLLQYNNAESVLCPTEWQSSTFPKFMASNMTVIHEGINTSKVRPNNQAKIVIEGKVFNKGDEILTYVSRTLEPLRGFHKVMRSLPTLLKERSQLRVIIVGRDTGGYGKSPENNRTWKEIVWNEVKDQLSKSEIDRIYFVGAVSYEDYLRIIQISMVHIYLTYPFVLSWSLVEAMSAGCAIVASDTDPVKEMIENGKNGVLVNFFDTKEITKSIIALIKSDGSRRSLGDNARKTILEKFDLESNILPRQVEWILR